MPDFREQLGDPDLMRFYDLWVSLRGERPMPSRKDLDPLQIGPEFLPNLMLIDVLREPRRYRYRLCWPGAQGHATSCSCVENGFKGKDLRES
jgi:hypothetical protein